MNQNTMLRTIAADPYPWPFDGDLRPANTALIIIDMQTDFCGKSADTSTCSAMTCRNHPCACIEADPPHFWPPCERRGLSGSCIRAKAIGPIWPICRPTNAGAPANFQLLAPASAMPGPCGRVTGARRTLAGISSRNLLRLPGETIIDKPGKGSFCATDLDLILRAARHSPTSS